MIDNPVKVTIDYSDTSKYDSQIFVSDDGSYGVPVLLDSPIVFRKEVGCWFWGNKTVQNYSSIKVLGQIWALNDLQQKYPPKIKIEIVGQGIIYDGKSNKIKYLGDDVFEFVLSDERDDLKKPLIQSRFDTINPINTNIIAPLSVGRRNYQVECILYDKAINKYVVCMNKIDGVTDVLIEELRDNGDLFLNTDYSTAYEVIDGTEYLTVTLNSPAAGVVTANVRDTGAAVAPDVAATRIASEFGYTKPIVYNATTYIQARFGNNSRGTSLYVNSAKLLSETFDMIADSINGFWYYEHRLGQIVFDCLKEPEHLPVTTFGANNTELVFDETNLLSKISVESDLAEKLTLKIATGKNYRPLRDSELAASLTEQEKADFRREFRFLATYEDTLPPPAPPPAVGNEIGGTVFIDADGNGIYVSGGSDSLVSGHTVRLLDNALNVLATTTTDASGNYAFTGLADGQYIVEFDQIAGHTYTLKDAYNNQYDDIDSDIDKFYRTDVLTITGGVGFAGIGAGFKPTNPLPYDPSYPPPPLPTNEYDSPYYNKDNKDWKILYWHDFNKAKAAVKHVVSLFTEKNRKFYTFDAVLNFQNVNIADICRLKYDGLDKKLFIIGVSGGVRSNKVKIKAWG